MTKEDFYDRFIKVVRPEHNVFKPLTKELMTENCLLDEFTEYVEKGIFTPIKGTDQYFINWNLLKSYIKDNSVECENKENIEPVQQLDNDIIKIIAEMKKEIDELKKENAEMKKEIDEMKKEIAELKKNEVDKTTNSWFYEKNKNSYISYMTIK